MPLPSSDKIAGFDFEKNVVLVKTGKIFIDEPVYETVEITADDKEIICDAWLNWRYRRERG